jgi:DNA-binding transcriptional MerR regulator
MTLQELSETAGVPARTIRFYIARGILAGPLKAGRAAAYGSEHVSQLERIKQMQSAGKSLVEISRLVEDVRPTVPLAAPAAWWQYLIGDEVTVSVRADAAPWRMRRIRAALEEFASALKKEDNDRKNQRNPE